MRTEDIGVLGDPARSPYGTDAIPQKISKLLQSSCRTHVHLDSFFINVRLFKLYQNRTKCLASTGHLGDDFL